MQISLKCGYCSHQYLSDRDEDLSMEIDFQKSQIRYLCRKCRKENVLSLAPPDHKGLPPIGLSRY